MSVLPQHRPRIPAYSTRSQTQSCGRSIEQPPGDTWPPAPSPQRRKMQHFHRSNQLFIQVGMRPLCAVRMCLTIPSRARQGIQSSGETAPVMGEPLTTSRASPADGFSRPATGAQMFGKGLLAIYTIAGS